MVRIHNIAADGLLALNRASSAGRYPRESGQIRDLQPQNEGMLQRPECRPIPGPPRGGNEPHNACADKIRGNDFPGLNVFINGKHFDALVLATRTLWEVKTDNFDIHSTHSQKFFIKVKLPEIQREKRLAEECGYDFVVGVRSQAHKAALEFADPSLKVVVMDWC